MRAPTVCLPSSLVWLEADCSALLEHKAEVLAAAKPACELLRVPTDLRQPADLLARVRAYRRVLVLSEGVLVYLDETEVSALARALASVPCLRRWLCEWVAPRQIQAHMKHWGEMPGEAHWKFAGGADFFAPYGWLVAEQRSFFAESLRLRRSGLRHPRLVRSLAACLPGFRRNMERAVVYAALDRRQGPVRVPAHR